MRLLVLIVFFTFGSHLTYGQSFNFLKTRRAVKSLKTAQGFINDKKFEQAKNQLLETIAIKEDFAVAHRELGKVLLELKKYSEAVDAYERSFEIDSRLSRAAYYECGEAYFRLEQFDKAFRYFKEFKALEGARYTNRKREQELEGKHQENLPTRLQNYEFAIKAIKKPTSNPPLNLGKSINTPQDEYLPTISGNGKILVYTTKKTYSPLELETGENIFFSINRDGDWTQGESFDNEVNTANNEGMAKFASDERYMYFAGCQRLDSYGGCDIYKATLDEYYNIATVNPLEGYLNSEVWDSQPTISCDGSVMYFTSNREGGFGGSDIWVSYHDYEEGWSIPENLGDKINTAGDEESPFIAPDGVTLYFASTGHPGMGDGDLFMTKRIETDTGYVWTEPQNLGYPINSPFQEVGLYIKPDGYTAYFASARQEGFGDLDIYQVDLREEYQPDEMVLLQGKVTDQLTNQPLQVDVSVMRSGKKWVMQTDKNGWYFICLPAKKAYAFTVNQQGYEYFLEAAFLAEQDNSIPFRFDIALQRNELPARDTELEPNSYAYNIYFDFDTYALDEKARSQLDDLCEKLKKETSWEVEVIGYTDNIGSAAYNKLLSEQRAKAVVAYLRMKGVRVDKVRQEGRGAVTVTEGIDPEKIREQNRRVEVVIRR